jgi:predicted ATPase/class 3 adenylate cyclase
MEHTMSGGNGFQISETLYRGNIHTVYRAVRQSDGLPMVLKVLSSEFPSPLEALLLKREYELGCSLAISGVPRFESFGKFDNRYAIFMEDSGGKSLRHLFTGRMVDIPTFLQIAIQLSQILGRLHVQQIIHRDIKPDNILYHPENQQAMLIDFGMAARIAAGAPDAVVRTTMEGTLAYISPEQTGRMNRMVDHRADFYALGMTCYELLAGCLPFLASHPLEWVHAHLAQEPADLRRFRPDLPEPLAQIIGRLLAKMAESRYQSAHSLQQDFQHCLRQWEATGQIASFPLGTAETRAHFHIPAKLYGREQEVKNLTEAIERVTGERKPELILVSGYSGVGKTAFVREAQKQVVAARGFYISGKFDQLNRRTPYLGLSLAFSELAHQLLAEKEEVIAHWRRRFLDALGSNIRLINELVPAFELVLGTHPPLPALSAEEASNRFLHTWQGFVKVLAQPEHPLILFLDDLQWADLASLRLMESLFSDPAIRSLCFIGAYRDNEISEFHPLRQAYAKAQKMLPVHEIHLSPLSLHHVNEMLVDMLGRPASGVMGLAQLLLAKTNGNPFFLIQALKALHEGAELYYDAPASQWEWDLERIQAMNITDNVVDLMVAKIKQGSPQAQRMLKLAACIGNEFSLRALSAVALPDELPALLEVVEQGLVQPQDDAYLLLTDAEQLAALYADEASMDAQFQFLHDRVQQAAYSLLTDEERQLAHLHLGRRVLSQTAGLEQSEKIFDICNHLNQGRALLADGSERLQLAELNLIAGRRAAAATAYGPALDYLNNGLYLMPADAWRQVYQLCYSLYIRIAECQYLNGETAEAEKTLDYVLARAVSRLDKLRVYRIMVDMLTVQVAHLKVIETIGEALKLFGIKMPRKPLATKLRVLADLLEAKYRMRNIQPGAIPLLPASQDEEHIELAGMLLTAGPSAYISNQDLFAWMVLFEVRYALRQGNTPSSSLGYMGYGMIVHAAFGDMETAYRLIAPALQLNEQMGNPFPVHKLQYVSINFIRHFKEEVAAFLEEMPLLYRVCLEAGDPIYAGFCLTNILWYGIVMGKNLDNLCEEGLNNLRLLKSTKNINSYDLLLTRLQAMLALNGRLLEPWHIEREGVDLFERVELYKAERSLAQLANLYTSILQMGYMLGEPALSYEQLEKAQQYTPYLNGSVMYFEFALYSILASWQLYQQSSWLRRRRLRQLAAGHMRQLHKAAAGCPGNYECTYLLVVGVVYFMRGRPKKALRLLEQAAEQGEKRELFNIVALAKELIAIRYIELGEDRVARLYLRESRFAYRQWGAHAKVRQLEQAYPALLLDSLAPPSVAKAELQAVDSSSSRNFDLDLASLMKSATAISGEILLDKLLPAMIHIVVENAGAQRGYLILEQDAQFVLRACQENREAPPVLLPALPVVGSGIVPESIINYTLRTRAPLILDYAAADERFRQDPYIQERQPKSILCVPILHKGVLKGAFYLENNLIAQAFSDIQADVAAILSAQTAVSLDNALLYKDLEEALEKQVILTNAYSRFTPREYLRFLGHDSILDVKLGDHRHENMTVLFSDVRSYTAISEQLTPEENFQLMSTYFKQMSKIVAGHQGIINQLLGDGIMAFFTDPGKALEAAVAMQLRLQRYNRSRLASGHIPLRVGIGLHTGPVIIGIMGDEGRMDITISSDTVNTASRIEGLTKHFGANILLSEQVVAQLSDAARQQLRTLGKVQLQGKSEEVGIFECFGGDEPETSAGKAASRPAFQAALSAYAAGQFQSAADGLSQVAALNADDRPAQFFLQKAQKLLLVGPSTDWTGVEQMQVK